MIRFGIRYVGEESGHFSEVLAMILTTYHRARQRPQLWTCRLPTRHDRTVRRVARPRPPPPGPYAAPKGYSVVPEIDVRAAAGAGAWNEESEDMKEA